MRNDVTGVPSCVWRSSGSATRRPTSTMWLYDPATMTPHNFRKAIEPVELKLDRYSIIHGLDADDERPEDVLVETHLAHDLIGARGRALELHAHVMAFAHFLDLVGQPPLAHALGADVLAAVLFGDVGEMRCDLVDLRVFEERTDDISDLVLRHGRRCLPSGVRPVQYAAA